MGKKLLWSITASDCEWQAFTVGGHGGSGKDTSNTGIRCVHRASGAAGEGREERSQLSNRRSAFRKMAATAQFKSWHKLEAARRTGQKSIDEIVDEAMLPINIHIEERTAQGWTPIP